MFPALAVTTPCASSPSRGLQDRVAGAADLERVDRLQRLELEVDLARPRRRRAARAACGPRAPAIVSRARRISSSGIRARPRRRRPRPRRAASTRSAAARSSTASPSDLKTVSSVSERRPSRRADQQLAELAADVRRGRPRPPRARTGSRPTRSRVDSRRSTKSAAAAIVALSSSRVVGMLDPTALTCVPSASHSRRTDRLARRGRGDDDVGAANGLLGGRRLLDVPPSVRAACPASGSRRARRSNGSTARIASRCDRACVPAPRIASVRESGRASSPRRDAGDRGGADRGDRAGVDERPQLARSRRRRARTKPWWLSSPRAALPGAMQMVLSA